jgi:sugar-specific transcriptional regulator TrmB
MKLGLTFLQAKIYLTIVNLQTAGVKRISVFSNIARPDVYRILPTLEKMGLVEKIVATPTMYEAIPMREGCKTLLQMKTKEYTDLHQNAMSLIKSLNGKKEELTHQNEPQEQFFLISSRTLLLKKFAIEDSTVNDSLDIIGDWKVIRPIIFDHIQIYERALNRGVRIRIITEKHENAKSAHRVLSRFEENPSFKIKYVDAPIPIKIALYDKKKANMCVRTIHDSEITPSLWSDNPEYVKVMLAYFEELWNRAQDSPMQPQLKVKSVTQLTKFE